MEKINNGQCPSSPASDLQSRYASCKLYLKTSITLAFRGENMARNHNHLIVKIKGVLLKKMMFFTPNSKLNQL